MGGEGLESPTMEDGGCPDAAVRGLVLFLPVSPSQQIVTQCDSGEPGCL